jgi:hypothetical protein
MSDYQSQKADLTAIAKVVYNAIEGAVGSAPNEAELEDALMLALLRSSVFAAMVRRRPHINPMLYQGYASALARIMLDNDWPAIKN